MICERCVLHKISRVNCIPGEGPQDAQIMLVGEALGKEEELYGRNFVGPAGRMLDDILIKVGLDRSKMFINNTVRCRTTAEPGSGKENRAPTDEEINACAIYLDKEIDAVKPKVVVPLGNVALSRILGVKSNITNMRGKVFKSEKYNALVIPTFHPSALFHHSEYLQFCIRDFTKVKDLMEGKEEKGETLNYIAIKDTNTLKDLVERMEDLNWFTVDIEATSLDFLEAQIICIGFSWKPGTGVSIPLLKKGELSEETILWWKKEEDYFFAIQCIKKILSNKAKKVLQNGSYDCKVVKNYLGIDINNYWFDTRLAHHAVNENMKHDLNTLSWIYSDLGGYKDVIKKYIKGKSDSYINIPTDVLLHYNTQDADVTGRVMLKLIEEMKKEGVENVFYNIMMPLQKVLIETEYNGVKIDTKLLNELERQYNNELEDIVLKSEKLLSKFYHKNIKVVAKKEKGKQPDNVFNLGSTKQLRKLLFVDLKLPVVTKSDKTGAPSIDEKVLESLKGKHDIVDIILNHRKVSKIKSTYIDGIKERLDKEGKIHTSYLVEGTRTGRLCVDKSTLLYTTRGVFSISKLDVKKKPYYILSHKGIYRKILSSFYKGKERMFRVELENGSYILCTLGHRFLTPLGWRSLYDMQIGEKVCSYSDKVQKKDNFGRREFCSYFFGRQYDYIYCKKGLWFFYFLVKTIKKFLLNKIFSGDKGCSKQKALFDNERQCKRKSSSDNYFGKRKVKRIIKFWKEYLSNCTRIWNERVLSETQYNLSWIDKEGYQTSSKTSNRGYRVLKKIRNILSRFIGSCRELLQRQRKIFYGSLWSFFRFNENGIFCKRSGKEIQFSYKRKEVKKRTNLLEFSQNRDNIGSSLRGFKNRLCSSISILQKIFCRFLFSISQAFSRNRWYFSFNKEDKEKRFREKQNNKKIRLYSFKNCRRGYREKIRLGDKTDTSKIRKIEYVGVREVWDIEVEKDHSYQSQGFINHNSSRDPNLQNIPREKKGKDIRKLFVASCGNVIVYGDMSQFELRVLTAYSRDKAFMDIFAKGEDPHAAVAVNDLGASPDDEEARMIAKTISFGIPYGRGSYTLAEVLKCSQEQAEEYLRKYFDKHRELAIWIQGVRNEIMQKGVVTTIFGRKRRINISSMKSKKEVNHNLNEATNYFIQSTASDIVSLITVKLVEKFKREKINAKLILTVHDSIAFDVIEEYKDLVKSSMKEIMEAPIKGFEHVPFKVDIKTGQNWQELVKEDDITEVLGDRTPFEHEE